ncbi:MAG: alpha-glucan family phosphorylase [Acidimicrobiales bacterium]
MKALRTYTVQARLPESLQPLLDIAMNLGWLSDTRVQALFARLDPRSGGGETLDPIGTLYRAPQEVLERLAADPSYVAQAAELRDSLERSLAMPRWFQVEHEGSLRSIAYFSAEFGIAKALPQYSGGLGILAGDHLKAADELGLPLVAVGLMYRHGYFTQSLDHTGWQREFFPNLDPSMMSLREIAGLRVPVEIGDVTVHARAWEARVGRVPLYLLDTNVEENLPADRLITNRLYGGDKEQRVRQELVLGVGGVRLLAELGYDPQVFHMNEGHAAFSALERIRIAMTDHGLPFESALELVRPSTLFTTHTPVPAGIDRFPRSLIDTYFRWWREQVGIDLDQMMALGFEPGTSAGEEMNMAALGLRLAEASNGVAKLHGEVSRSMFQNLWPDLEAQEVPIGHVTNGVNARTWVMREMNDLLERKVGHDWAQAAPERWNVLESVGDEQLRSIRSTGRARLVQFARNRMRQALIGKGVSEPEAEWANEILDPDVLTIGFARRFATYKRADLLLRNENRLRDLMRDPERPVQFVFAGKAHPADEPGKRVLQRVAQFALDARNRTRFVYLDDYDIEVGRYLYQGVDVWLNNPRRPLEACGTSGMKVVYNGGLNLSILDGWWAEMYAHDLGFSIPTAWWIDDVEARDEQESRTLFRVLEDSVIPEFYGDDGVAGPIPSGWLDRVRNSMVRLGPMVESSRMVRDYVNQYYEPLAVRTEHFRADPAQIAGELAAWKARVAADWSSLSIVDVDETHPRETLGAEREVSVSIDLGRLSANDIDVQVVHGQVDLEGELTAPIDVTSLSPIDADDGDAIVRYSASLSSTSTGSHGFTVRVVPQHPDLGGLTALHEITWAK